MEFYNLEVRESLKKLKTSEKGLSKNEAVARLQKYGPNELKKSGGESIPVIFLRQFKSSLIIILIAAAIVALYISLEEKEYPTDTIVILVIVVLNAIVGFIQEYRAERSLEALKKLTCPYATVIRGGKQMRIPASELVPGDIIILEMGDKVPADARVVDSLNLKVDEAALTGESVPVSKEAGLLKGKVSLADRKNMLYAGTVITYGKGRALVAATGMDTELGRIAGMVQEAGVKETPLQSRLAVLGKQLGILVIVISAIIFTIGILKIGWTPENVTRMFLAAVALSVAAIPEGLPAIVTMALALGTQRMAKKNAIIRKLPAVETLGSCDVICSDKTGTLTKNEMTVRWIYADGKGIEVTGGGYGKEGDFLLNGKRIKPGDDKALEMLLQAGILCNNASIDGGIVGDPTEISLLVAGAKAGMEKERLEDSCPRLHEIQFDSERKRMSTVNGGTIYTKGAVEVVLGLCDRIYGGGKVERLADAEKRSILEKNGEMAGNALRLLGFAYKELRKGADYEDSEQGLIFLGMAGMIDSPREEAVGSIRVCKKAGIDVKMITGDHALTAKAIAKELEMLDGEVVTGVELDAMSDDELAKRVDGISVFARVNPEHKLRIVEALQKNGHIVAMTGDGVNDAPALKKSDIGVAMGITGTEVTKEASSMVLTDDNFATIVSAVEEGRIVYDNIKKFIRFLLSSNLGEVLTLFIAILIFSTGSLREVLILIPVQILWVNLVTDGAPALALGLEPAEKGIMRRPPRLARERIFSGIMLKTILIVGFTIAIGTIWVFNYYLGVGENEARTMAFTTLVMFQLVNVFNCKSESESLFKVGVLNNRYLILAVIASILLQFIVIYAPFLTEAFKTVPIGFVQWVIIIEVALSAFLVVELYKIVERRRSTSQRG